MTLPDCKHSDGHQVVEVSNTTSPAELGQSQSSGAADESWKDETQEIASISSINFANQGDFREGAVIGKGGFGLVSKIIHRKTRRVFVCKTLIYTTKCLEKGISFSDIIEDGHREIENHRAVRHPSIVCCFGGWIQQTGTEEGDYDVVGGALICKYSLILEFMAGGTLSDVVLKRKKPPTSSELHKWIFQISLGLDEIHSRGAAHFDLKPDNILLTGKLNAKIADLGGMVPTGSQEVVTVAFAAPECFEGSRKTGPAYDMFALGLTILCCTLRLTNGDKFLAVSVLGKPVGKVLAENPALDLKQDPALRHFFENQTMASVLAENLLEYDPAKRFSAQQCMALMGRVPPDQFTTGDPENLVANDVNEYLESFIHLYSEDQYEDIVEPTDPKTWMRIFIFSIFLLGAFLAVLIQFAFGLSENQIPYEVGGYLMISIMISIFSTMIAGTFLLYMSKISIYFSFSLVYIVDIILSLVLAQSFAMMGERVRLALAVVYAISKIIAAYIPFKYLKLTSSLVCAIIGSMQFLFQKAFRSVWAVAFLTLALQICILFLGFPYVVEPWLLPTGTSGIKVFTAFVNLYVFLWLLNLPRYCLHYLCVSLYRNAFAQIKSTSPLFDAAHDCVLSSGIGVLVVSLFSVVSPACSFAVSFFTSLMWVSGAIAATCATCGGRDNDEQNCCETMCLLTACGSAAVGTVSFFLVKIIKGILTYVTKLNLTTMVILRTTYSKATMLTALNKKINKYLNGNASLVTENIVSAHISNTCVLIGGLMFVILNQFMPSLAFYALITGYVTARTLFEPVDAWVLTGYTVFDNMREFLPALTGNLELQQEFEANRKIAQGEDEIDQSKTVQEE